MESLTEERIICPYCGESIDILVDGSEMGQAYIEDCQVCCRPMTLVATLTVGGELTVSAHSEDETF